MASLIKVLLALRERVIPPSVNFEEANQLTGLADSPFFVNTQVRQWTGEPRLAAISSFGFSGTNCHLLVAEHLDGRPPTVTTGPEALVPLSARDPQSLRQQAAELARWLDRSPQAALHDVAGTLHIGRATFEHRLAIIASSVDQLRARLDQVASGMPAGDQPAGTYLGFADPDEPAGPTVTVEPGGDLHQAARQWVAGGSLDSTRLYPRDRVRRLNLPGYTFASHRCWLPSPAGNAPAGPAPASAPASDPPAAAPPAAAPGPQPASQAPNLCTGDRVDGPVLADVLVAAAAAELGVPADRVDVRVPAEVAGFDAAGRARLVARLNRELNLQLPPDAFPAGCSLAALGFGPVQAALLGEPMPAVPTTAKDASDTAANDTPASDTAASDTGPDLAALAEEYLKQLLATEARLSVDRIRVRAPLQEYGIESVLITRLNQHLEEAFGAVSSTLFFEYQTIAELAAHLADRYPARVRALAGADPARPVAATAAVTTATAPAPASAATRQPRTGDIAIIGMAGRYPMARDNDEFWQNLLAGRDCIIEVPADRWDHQQYLSDDPDEPGTTYARWGGFLDDVDKFDARFFRIPPKEAEGMDPQQRLFLETAWAAVEDAGYTPERIRRSAARRGKKDAGVFAGVTYGDYQLLVGIPVVGYWAVANRVSYHLGFNGPSMAVDTACSASMTAVHLAVESLRRGECEYALAGGVNVTIHPGKFLLLGYGRWASTDGRCRTFGAGGTGYVPSEGVATLLLKPLADAEEDGDRIYGVIRASAVNHDGRTNGFNVPNPKAQAQLVREALDQAGVDPRELSYVEAHGTGTSLGDPIEITALTKAFREHNPATAGTARSARPRPASATSRQRPVSPAS